MKFVTQTIPNKPQTSLVNAAAFMSACKSKGAISFQITSLPTVVTSLAVQTREANPEIPGLPEEYQEYRDVFSTQKAKLLPEHRPYDLAIQIEGDKISPLGPIYSLLALELKTLQEFLEENIKTGIICLSKSPCGCPGVTPQMNFLRKITFDMLYTNEFLIKVHSRTLSIPSEHNTI